MAEYTKSEAREWAMEQARGVCGCLLPTLTNDLQGINEAAIRHDMRLEKKYGFWGSLLVSETGTTVEEMKTVTDIAVDEAQKLGLRTMALASYATLEETIDMVKYAESAGADTVLLSYPVTFYPKTESEIFDFTKAVADSTNLGVFLFAFELWNFGRFHPNGFSPQLIERLVNEVPNIVGIKNEVGHPGIAGNAEIFRKFRDRIVVTDPWERNAPAWASTFGMPFMGTSNYEYLGDRVPAYFNLLQEGKYDEAMDIYWKIHPARKAYVQVNSEAMAGTNFVHRISWKYQYWLSGFNGGPVRGPQPRIHDRQMKVLRNGLIAAGLPVTDSPDAEFFVGRNPA